MANVRLSMRKVKEVLRLSLGEGMSARRAAQSCGIGRTAAREYVERARNAGLTWPLPVELDETSLENMLFPSSLPLTAQRRNMPAFDYIYRELRKKHTTLQLLWHEYRENNTDGYQYSQFCLRYREWLKTLDVSLRQEHKAGEKLFVDFAGDTIPVYDEMIGASAPAYLFVGDDGRKQLHLCAGRHAPGPLFLDKSAC
jgi:transposase